MKTNSSNVSESSPFPENLKTIVRPRPKKSGTSRVKLPWLRIIDGEPVVITHEPSS